MPSCCVTWLNIYNMWSFPHEETPNCKLNMSIHTSEHIFIIIWDLIHYMRRKVINVVSEWVLFNAMRAIVHLYHGDNKWPYNETGSDLQLFVWGLMFYLRCVCAVVSNTCCVVFCFSSSCVPYVASFTGVSIFTCPLGIL